MPDVEQRIILRESTAPKKEYSVYAARGKSTLNKVLLKRNAFHEVHLCVHKDDGKKILKREITGGSLECVVRDTSRSADGGPDTELRLFPLLPRRASFIDLNVMKIEFTVGSLSFADVRDPPSTWSSVTDAEAIYEAPGVTNLEHDPDVLLEYHVAETIDASVLPVGGGTEYKLAEFRLHPDVPAATRLAASVGFHQYTRSSHLLNRINSVAAMTGTVMWADLESQQWRIELAGTVQANLQAALDVGVPPKRYVVKRYEDIETTWGVPFLGAQGFRMRPDYVSAFTQFPANQVSGLGLTQPTFYKPTGIGAGSMLHFSTLVMPPIVLRSLAGVGLANAQAMLDTQAAVYERCVKAAERTIAGYLRASRRTDRVEMGGYFAIPIGSEVASVTYSQGRTIVEFQDDSLPLWPRVPVVSTPQISAVLVTITDKTQDPRVFVGSYSAPHSGRWAPASFISTSGGWNPTARPTIVEDKLGLFPWLDVGDSVLCLHDGDRAVILNTTLSADVELI